MARFSQEGCVCGSFRGFETPDSPPSNLVTSWRLPNWKKRFLVGENERGPKLVSRHSLSYPLPQAIPLLPSRAGVCHTEAKPEQVTQKSPTVQRGRLCGTGASWGRSAENPLRTPPLVAPSAASSAPSFQALSRWNPPMLSRRACAGSSTSVKLVSENYPRR